MTTRRDFIAHVGAVGGLFTLGARTTLAAKTEEKRPKPLRLLILGGTGHIGPWFVRAAAARGHHVAIFSRGNTEADLPADIERLKGDRNGDLRSIQERDWDAVLDLATMDPEWVKSLGKALQGRVRNYMFISTIAVYDHPELNDRTRETSQLLGIESRSKKQYGVDKMLCEREAERQFPNKTLILRPGYIVGPDDRLGFLTFWQLRVQQGGEVLVPGDSLLPVQYVDVRDLAEFAIRQVEQSTTGIFNVCGPAAPMTLGPLMDAIAAVEPTTASIVWVPAAKVAAQPDVGLWNRTLFWSWSSETAGHAQDMRMSNDRALARGLTFRPLAVTLADSLKWYRQLPPSIQARYAPGYRRPNDGEAPVAAEALWARYLQREHELIAEYRKEQSSITRNAAAPRV